MSKGKWFTRALHMTIALSFVLGAFVVAPSVSAEPGTSQWEKQSTPTEDDKVILPGSDITDFDVAGDGKTIYAIGTWYNYCDAGDAAPAMWSAGPVGPNDLWSQFHFPKLWKSTDGGVTWKDQTSKALDAKNLPDLTDWAAPFDNDWEDFAFFTAVSVAPDDPDFVVVTGWGYEENGIDVADIEFWDDGANADVPFTYYYVPVVVGSNDGASKFNYMGCAAVTGMITSVDVSMEVDDVHSIAIGTWDWEVDVDAGAGYIFNLGSVWRYDAGGYWGASWANAGTYDGWEPCNAVIDLEFSPNFDVDDAIVALCVDWILVPPMGAYPGYIVQSGTWDSIDAWNAEAEFDSYPVVINNAEDAITSFLGIPGWDAVGPLVRHAGDIDLPFDYMGDDNSDRKFMVAVNGIEVNIAGMSLIDDGGFLFWVENTELSEEMLYKEDNPYISTIDYSGNIDMEGRTLVGLMFPKDWKWQEINDWYDSDGNELRGSVCIAKPNEP